MQVKTIESPGEQVGEQMSANEADTRDSNAAKASHWIMVVGIRTLFRLDRAETGDKDIYSSLHNGTISLKFR